MGDSRKRIFGDNVRQLRETLGITQEGLSEVSGLDRSYIGGVERGECNPRLATIIRLAVALRVAPGRLFDGLS